MLFIIIIELEIQQLEARVRINFVACALTNSGGRQIVSTSSRSRECSEDECR